MLCAAEESINFAHSIARRKHMTKVNRLSITPEDTVDELCHRISASLDGETPKHPDHHHGTHPSLSVELPSIVDSVVNPNAVLEGAEETVVDPNKIVPAPGCSALARMVESKTARRPHLVTPGKGWQIFL